jgi:hypothetical protein
MFRSEYMDVLVLVFLIMGCDATANRNRAAWNDSRSWE